MTYDPLDLCTALPKMAAQIDSEKEKSTVPFQQFLFHVQSSLEADSIIGCNLLVALQ